MFDVIAAFYTTAFAYGFVETGHWSMLLFSMVMGYQLSRK